MSGQNLSSFGYKIVDREWAAMSSVLNLALDQKRPLEVGIYFDEDGCRDHFSQQLPTQSVPVNVHLDHRRLSVLQVCDQSRLLQQQIALGQSWGADYGITHVSAFPLSVRQAYQKDIFLRLESGLAFLQEIALEKGFPVHIENTFHSLSFYQQLFDLIDVKGYDQLHFCLDIGHAKVWSSERLEQWLDFTDQLSLAGRHLHFHLHANSGVTDEHLSLQQAEYNAFTMADDFTGELDLFQSLGRIQQRFPRARKIFEVPPQEVGETMTLLQERLLS